MPGTLGGFILNPETNREAKLPLYLTNHRFVCGDVISIRTPGGGGCGDPKQHARELVEEDLRCGYGSLNIARDVYSA